ncbi:hypothetical protein [Shewanella xiamenensis]|uniref:hypothetical protein n=1 Tax=Shewanella xiamenensis TaxID=332186 RepID=UPI0035B769A3
MLNKYKYHVLKALLSLLMFTNIGQVHANNSQLTEKIVGHKPVITNVKIDKPTPQLGETLTLAYDYTDADQDAEAAPSVTWYYNNNPVAGQTGKAYTPIFNYITGSGNACTDFTIRADVTPKSITGDPKIGDTTIVAPVTVAINLQTIPGFILPDTITRTWSQANAFCISKGAHLPTVAQLKKVFSDYTSGGINDQMSKKYGWPLLGGRCGGGYATYWASTQDPISSGHYDVNMMDGGEFVTKFDDSLYHTACTTVNGPAELPTAVTLTYNSTATADINGSSSAGRPVVTIDEITANLTFVPNTDTDLSNYRFEWFADGISTRVIKDGINTFTPRVEDQGKKIKAVVSLKP